MKCLLFALVLMTVCVGSLLAVECYTCAYVSGVAASESCNDPFNATSQLVLSCEGQCTKTTTTLNGELQGLTRACVTACAAGCSSALGIEACVYCCDSDRCNGASSVTFGLISVCVTVLTGWIASAW